MSHGTGDVSVLKQTNPASQSRQDVAFCKEYVPVGQANGGAVVLGQYEPAGHKVHVSVEPEE